MDKLFTIVMYTLWTITLIGILVITFTNFKYFDLNIIVAFLTVITFANTFFTLKKK